MLREHSTAERPLTAREVAGHLSMFNHKSVVSAVKYLYQNANHGGLVRSRKETRGHTAVAVYWYKGNTDETE